MTPAQVPQIPGRGSAADLLRGLAFPLRAISLVLRTPALRRLALISAAVTLVSFIVLVGVLLHWVPRALGALWPRSAGGLPEMAWAGAAVLLFGLAFLLGASVLPLLVLAPLQDVVSEATEAACGVPVHPAVGGGFLRQAFVALAHTALRVAILLGGHAVLLVLHLLPGVGSAVWTVLGFLWTAVWACAEYLDAPMTRHLRPFSQVLHVLRVRTALSLGFGVGVAWILWIPFLNLLFVPVAVCAGTLLFRALIACGTLPE